MIQLKDALKCPGCFRANVPWFLESEERKEAPPSSSAASSSSSSSLSPRLKLLKQLLKVLSSSSKYEMCLKCGFGRLWSGGLRRGLVEMETTGNGKKKKTSETIRDDVDGVWLKQLRWSCYDTRPKEPKKGEAAGTGGDTDDDYEKKKKRKELFVDQRSGNIIAFLDEFEKEIEKHVVHRSILARQKASADEFEHERRPGVLSIDIDFAENYTIETARQVQSEYWSNTQCTLFICVATWLKVAEWDKVVGDLPSGAEVLVYGEKSGVARNDEAFLATVQGPVHGSGSVGGSSVVLYKVVNVNISLDTESLKNNAMPE